MRKASYQRILLHRQTDRLWLEADRLETTHPQQRFRMLLKLVRQGHNNLGLISNLAISYGDGQGVKRNLTQAFRWHRKAWRRGDSLAAFNAGMDHNRAGHTAAAILWFSRAVAMEQVDAFVPFARLLLHLGGHQAEAVSLLRKRVAAGAQISCDLPVSESGPRFLEDEELAEATRLLAELEV